MRTRKPTNRDGPNTPFVPAARVESIPADSLQNFKRTGFACRGIDLMAHRVKVLIIPAKGLDAPLGNQTVRFVLRFKEVIVGFGEKEQIFEIDSESVLYTLGQAVGLLPNDGVAQNPASIQHLEGKAKRDQEQ